MPSRDRKRSEKKKSRYAANTDSCKQKAHQNYTQNAETIKQRSKARASSDATLRKKHLQSQKVKLITDQEYCEKNKTSARINTQRRLQENALYKEKK